MSIFKNASSAGLEKTEDRLGGFQVFDTDAYDAVIKMAYADQAESGAQNINFIFQMPGGKTYSETVYWTNKKGENWFPNKDDPSKKVPLPGFTLVDDICMCTTEKGLEHQDTEERMVKIYDYNEKKEVNKSRHVLVDLLNQPVTLTIQNVLKNKQVKGDDNTYVSTAEERNENNIVKAFHTETRLSMVEAREGQDATFLDKWVEANKGKVIDKRDFGKNGVKSGSPSNKAAPQPGQSAPSAGAKSLFGKK